MRINAAFPGASMMSFSGLRTGVLFIFVPFVLVFGLRLFCRDWNHSAQQPRRAEILCRLAHHAKEICWMANGTPPLAILRRRRRGTKRDARRRAAACFATPVE